jgi:hypothetical protein
MFVRCHWTATAFRTRPPPVIDIDRAGTGVVQLVVRQTRSLRERLERKGAAEPNANRHAAPALRKRGRIARPEQ